MIVLILLLQRQHHSLEAGVQLSIAHQSIFGDDVPDKLIILGVVLLILVIFQVVHPVILRVVFNVGQFIVDSLHH